MFLSREGAFKATTKSRRAAITTSTQKTKLFMFRSNEKISRSEPKYCSARMKGVVNRIICTVLELGWSISASYNLPQC